MDLNMGLVLRYKLQTHSVLTRAAPYRLPQKISSFLKFSIEIARKRGLIRAHRRSPARPGPWHSPAARTLPGFPFISCSNARKKGQFLFLVLKITEKRGKNRTLSACISSVPFPLHFLVKCQGKKGAEWWADHALFH